MQGKSVTFSAPSTTAVGMPLNKDFSALFWDYMQ